MGGERRRVSGVVKILAGQLVSIVYLRHGTVVSGN